MADATSIYPGLLTGITNDYMHVFEGYTSKFIVYGKQIFAVLLAINIAWIAIWYAFDKDSLAAGMSDFLKKFVVAILLYSIMISPVFTASFVNSSIDMGLGVTGLTSLDPSSIITLGANAGFKIVGAIKIFSLNAIANIVFGIVAFFIVVFCFMSVALQVAIAQIIASALVMFSCFSLSFAALGQTAPIARKTLDALIGICFKLLGYYIVIGSSMITFTKWKTLPNDFFSEPRNNLWVCASALVFWLLSKSLAGVFERIGGGIVGETDSVDFAALAISAAKTAVMGLSKEPNPASDKPKIPPGGNSPNFDKPKGGAAVSLATGGEMNNTKHSVIPSRAYPSEKSASTAGNGKINKSGSSGDTNTNKKDKSVNASSTGRQNVVNFKEKAAQRAEAENKRTYPRMSQDGKQYKTG